MIDWCSSMTQTYEFVEVDPKTWKDKKRLDKVFSSCSISRDLESDTIETASMESTEILSECYVRVYLVATQKKITEKICLGTFLLQTPNVSFDGKNNKVSIDAYSPLLELKDKYPPIGFTIAKNQNIMDNVCTLTRNNLRAPVIPVSGVNHALPVNFTSEHNETWLAYLSTLMANANYRYMLDEIGRVLFIPKQDISSLQPRWTYTDDNSSILYPDISDKYDLYGVPNVVEVVCSGEDGVGNPLVLYSKVVNDNPESPTSITARGREVFYRETNPSVSGIPNQEYIDQYAEQLLKDFNSIEHTIVYSHGYCPVRIGDCVRLNYERAGIKNVKAKVIRQDIKCSGGCKVSETAIYSSNLWKED